ncbi:MAG TPA: TlpA disulfide reductase family protein [Chitinophagaceae bacterium]
MKKIFVASIITLLIFNATQAQKLKTEFGLHGRVEGLNEGMLYLQYQRGGNVMVRDSSAIKNGFFSFKGSLSEPVMAFLSLKEEKRTENNSLGFFLEPGVINMTIAYNDFRNAKISGSTAQQEYEALNKMKEPIRKEMQPALDEYTAANKKYMEAVKSKQDDKILDELKEKANAVRSKFTPFNERQSQVDMEFFRKHPTSPVTAYMMRFYVSKLPLDSLQMYYDRFGTALQQTQLGKSIDDEIRQLRNGSPGSMAKDFAAMDINGKKLSLSEHKGKYVLLDFWASWCVPCRKGNPHLRELYSKYKNKGIEFIGIADDDRDEAAWRKAVDKDSIGIWKHVRRGLKFANGNFDRSTDISENFGIHTLPTKILIDPKGIIVGRYYEEEEPLNKKLKEIFGE